MLEDLYIALDETQYALGALTPCKLRRGLLDTFRVFSQEFPVVRSSRRAKVTLIELYHSLTERCNYVNKRLFLLMYLGPAIAPRNELNLRLRGRFAILLTTIKKWRFSKVKTPSLSHALHSYRFSSLADPKILYDDYV